MKLLILCAFLSACVAVSLASPASIRINDDLDSSSSSESSEVKVSEKNSSSSEEQDEQVKNQESKVKDNSDENDSADSSEEQQDKNQFLKEENNEINSIQEETVYDHDVTRYKRAVVVAPNAHNQLAVKDEGSIKYEKYLKLKRLSRDLLNTNHRIARSADSSEENSSEENKKGTDQAAHAAEKGIVVAQKPETAAADTLDLAIKPDTAAAESEIKPETESTRRRRYSPNTSEENSSEEEDSALAGKNDTITIRRRRNVEISHEEDLIQEQEQAQDANEVFIFSQEKQNESEENFNDNNFKNNNNKPVRAEETNLQKSDSFLEIRNSEEDYAQGCGGSRDTDSDENSHENNETLNNQL